MSIIKDSSLSFIVSQSWSGAASFPIPDADRSASAGRADSKTQENGFLAQREASSSC